MRQLAASAVIEGPNQYPPMLGIPELRQAIAIHNKRSYNLDLDWKTETMVTCVATDSHAACMLALIEHGDEVVMIEPLYDSYLPMVQRAGGIPKLVRIEPQRWALPKNALAAAFSEKTKFILLNSPQNPAAKVYNQDELQFKADLVIKHDTYAVCDEVYEHIVFDTAQHIPLMSLPGMRNRCIRIGSAGKTFSMTAWKVGFMTSSAALLRTIARAHQFITFATPTNLQRAFAMGLEQDNIYSSEPTATPEAKRKPIATALTDARFKILQTAGIYFLSVDIRSVGFKENDVVFCEYIIRNAGVAAIPLSAFYQKMVRLILSAFVFVRRRAF